MVMKWLQKPFRKRRNKYEIFEKKYKTWSCLFFKVDILV